ncbi:LLM class flavin-dependent oxidoreductase [Streptosporangium sp. NPDC051022]|uniref:LLM class flavin-dependent oxidoreductase n=1 Tax=Streptosporangium sp. NPDC051022 TaxID=3155752 RepID=UPI00344658E5
MSVLDLVPVGSGQYVSDALEAGARLAMLAESRGYHRYWVAEHHGSAATASSSPAILLAYLAARTSRLRLGSGGVMLPNYAPLVVAEQFGMLEALAPGRIDLGIGRAFGTDKKSAAALRRDGKEQQGNDFPQQVAELTAFLDGSFPEDHPYSEIPAIPGPLNNAPSALSGGSGRPPLYILGSSVNSGRLAGSLGLPYCYAHHIDSGSMDPALAAYRECFEPSAALSDPYVVVATTAFAADDPRVAITQLYTGELTHLLKGKGVNQAVPSPREAQTHRLTDAERLSFARALRVCAQGTPEEVRKSLWELVQRTGADEVMITSFTHDTDLRLRSYELIADEFNIATDGQGSK